MDYQGKAFSYEKISDQPPKVPETLKPRVAIKLDTKLLDACVGHYEFAPDAVLPSGAKLTISREGDQLVWQAWGEERHPRCYRYLSRIGNEFLHQDQWRSQLTFIKNDKGEVTCCHPPLSRGCRICEGKKLKN